MQFLLTFAVAWLAMIPTSIIFEWLRPKVVSCARRVFGWDGLRTFEDYLDHHVVTVGVKCDRDLFMAELSGEKLTEAQQEALAQWLKKGSDEAISQYVASRAQKSL